MGANGKQCQRILEYLREGNTLTSLEAWRELGVARLASRVYDLRKAGYPIQRKTVTVTNRYGEKVSIKEYSIGDEE